MWSHFQLLDWTEHSTQFRRSNSTLGVPFGIYYVLLLCGRSWLLNDAGETVLYFDSVHLQEVRDEHLQKARPVCNRVHPPLASSELCRCCRLLAGLAPSSRPSTARSGRRCPNQRPAGCSGKQVLPRSAVARFARLSVQKANGSSWVDRKTSGPEKFVVRGAILLFAGAPCTLHSAELGWVP